MTERDPLTNVLRAWQAVEPSPEFDERMLQAFRKAKDSFWNRLWHTRVTVPLPALAFGAMLLLALVLWVGLRERSPATPPIAGGIVTHLDAAGFQPLPHGDARVITLKELYR